MQYDWVSLINDVVAGGVAVAGMLGALKKWPWILKGAIYIEQHAADIVKTVETVAESPAGAVIKNTLHHEIDQVTEKLQKSEIGRLALVGLHSFNANIANLSDTQKVALIVFVKTSLPQWNISDEQIKRELDAMQMAAKAFSELEIVKAANLFTAASTANDRVNVVVATTTTASAGVNTNV